MSLETTETPNNPASAGDSTGAAQAASKAAFDFAAPYRDVRINATPNADTPLWIWYRLNQPTRQQQKDYQNKNVAKNTYVGNSVRTQDGGSVESAALLFRDIASAVRYFDFEDGSDPQQFVALTPERLAALMKVFSFHASAAIAALYQGKCVPVEARSKNVLKISQITQEFTLRIGGESEPTALVSIKARNPSESAWRNLQLDRHFTDTSQNKGGKGQVVQKTIVNRVAYAEFLKDVVIEMDATVKGKALADTGADVAARSDWFNGIDLEWAYIIGSAIESAVATNLSD